MNSGTSKRDYLTPMGCEAFSSVCMANLLVSRLVGSIMFLFTTCLLQNIPTIFKEGCILQNNTLKPRPALQVDFAHLADYLYGRNPSY